MTELNEKSSNGNAQIFSIEIPDENVCKYNRKKSFGKIKKENCNDAPAFPLPVFLISFPKNTLEIIIEGLILPRRYEKTALIKRYNIIYHPWLLYPFCLPLTDFIIQIYTAFFDCVKSVLNIYEQEKGVHFEMHTFLSFEFVSYFFNTFFCQYAFFCMKAFFSEFKNMNVIFKRI